MRRVVLVFFGGGAGAALRALLLWQLSGSESSLPAGVLLVNLIGALVLGVIFVLADEAGLLRAGTRLFLTVGVLGGFTTFSTLGWGTDLLVGKGQSLAALIYLVVSVAGGVLAVGLGMIAAREAVGLLERGALAVLQRLNARGHRRFGDVRVDMASIEAENRDGMR
jgi:fluoride exporter